MPYDLLTQIIYISSTRLEISENELLLILIQARENNEKNGISGMLVYADGIFIQALEGDEETLNRLMLSIMTDSRQEGVIEIERNPIISRQFSDWTMGFEEAKNLDIPGITNFLELNVEDRLKLLGEQGFAQEIFASFSQ